ncbi:unnamed protein product, partial [Rotaria sp. Silwood2]
MADRVSSSFNSKTKNKNISLSNNHSTYTTNTSHNISSSNFYPTYSMNRHSREYEPSYPSITRYRTASSSSPYRKAHYLDDFIEEIIHEEILEITYLDHYPTLLERWGDDAKTIVKQQGENIIEDYVEFEEVEPTITEEISYEIIYENNEIKSTREIHHSRSESRNFRKIKKRRIKHKYQIHDIHTDDVDKRATQLLDNMHNLSIKIDSIIQTGSNFNDDLSGDDYELTNIDHTTEHIIKKDLEDTYETIRTINNGDDRFNGDIIANGTSLYGNEEILLQPLKSDEQQENLSNETKQEYQNVFIPQRIDDEEDSKESHPSFSILTNETCIPSDDHEIISPKESSINKSNEENKKILESELQSTTSKIDQQKIIIEQVKTTTQEKASGHDNIQSIQNQSSPTTETSLQSLTNEKQITLPLIEHDFDDDLLSFLKSLLSHLMPNSFDENNQCLIAQTKLTQESISNIDSQTSQNIPIDNRNDSHIETFQPNIKFEELTKIDKTLTDSHINHENLLSESNKISHISETKQQTISKDITKSNEIENVSSKVSTEGDLDIHIIPLNFQLPSDNVKISLANQQENIHDDINTQIPESIITITDKQNTMFDDLQLSIEEETNENEPEGLSLTNQTIAQGEKSFLNTHIETTDQTNQLLESTKSSTTIDKQQKSTLKDYSSTADNISQENKVENLSSNSLIQIVHEILATPNSTSLSSVNIKPETIKQTVDKPSINSLEEIIQQIKTILLAKVSKIEYDPMQNIHEDKNQSDSNIISLTTETVQKPFDETDQTYAEETTILSNDPATLVTTYQPSGEIKINIITPHKEKTDETLNTNLNIEVDKQLKAVSTQSTTMIRPEKELIQKTYSDEDENVKLSSDSLVGIIRQIRATTSATHFPLVNHTSNVIDKPTNNFINETTEQIHITSIPTTNIEDNKLLESTKNLYTIENIHQTNIDNEAKHISSNVIDETLIRSTVDDNTKVNIVSNDIKSSSDSLMKIVHQILSSAMQSILHINSSASPITDVNTQTNVQSSMQDILPNESKLLTTSIIPELSNSIYQDESLNDINKKSISSSVSITSNDIVTETISDIPNNLQQSTDINSINQFISEPSYSVSELTNVMNGILNFSMKTSDDNFSNIPQQSKIIEQTTSTKSFTPETSIAETDFQDFYQRQYFSSPNIKQISLDLTSIDDEQLDQKKSTPDLTKIYYELQEQRHIQPLHIYEQIEQKQETSDDNLNNPVQQIDLTSFSQISNLPSREYHQVFGVSNEIVNTVNDSTNYIDQIIPSNVSDEVKSITFDSNEKSQITEIFEDNRSIVSENQEQLNNESMPNIISNAEFDFRYSSLLNRLDTLAKPLLNLPLSSSIIANELTLSKTHQEKDTYDHLNERYDVLIDHVNTLDATIHASPIIKMTDIDKQVTTFSSDDQHNELMNNSSSLSDKISHTTPQYPTTDTEIISTFNIIESTDTFKNPTAELPDGKTTITLSNPLKIESNIVSNQLPGHYDDYPWYSSYYTIAQAETKLGQLYKQLNFVDEQNCSSSTTEFHEILSSHDHELQNEQDQDNDEEGFHIVHRRKRIPSSTTHTNILPSIIVPTKLPISSDIDLEPVILHGHSTAPAITASITPQTINISSKTKHKKKKKEKSEVIFFDAPELISSDSNKQQIDATQSELVQQEFPVNNETINSSQTHRTITHECEQLQPTSNVISNEQQQPEVLSTLTSSNIDELKLVADNKNELTSNGVSSLSSALVKMPSDENIVKTQTIEQQSIDKESNQQSAPSFTTTSISSIQQISIDDHKQQDDTTSKPGYQDLQVLYDDNQSNSNYNTISDAETTKLDHLNEELNLANEQNRSPTTAHFHETPSTDNHELESVKNQDDDEEGFHIVHRRKRIPSSTTHAKILPSTTIVTQSTLSSDIDLEPVILHGHPTAPTTTSPTVSETTNIPSKTRHKKKKKAKTEMVFFDAPQLISSNLDKQKTDIAPSELVKQEDTVNIGTMDASQLNQITKDECEPSPAISSVISDEQQQQQQQPIALSTLITSNIDELKQVADNKHELTCNNVSPLSSAPVTIPADEIKVHTQSIEQQSKEKPSILQSVPSSITTTLSSIQQTTVDDQEQEDDTANESSYEELQVLYDDYPWYSSYYAIADAEEKIAHLYKPLKHVDQQSCFSATVKTHETLIIQKHELESEKDQDNDDEFHVVHRRKRIPSSTTQTKTLPSATMTTKPPTSPDIDLEPVILHGHPAAPTITSPIVSETTNIPSKTKHKKKKKDTTEMIFFDAPELTSPDAKKEKIHDKQSALVEQAHQVNIETMDSSQLNRIIASEYEQLESTPTDISDVRQQPEVSSTLTISNADELELVADNKKELTSTDVSLLSSTLVTIPSDQIIVNIEQNRSPTIADYHERPFPHDHELENVKDENDDEGDFHIVHRRKRIPSSTAHAKTLPSSTKTTASTLSSDIDLEPVILHGHPTAPTTTSPIVSKIMDTPSKTKHKKKKDKTEMIFFDAPELTSLDANNQKSDVAQSQLIEQEHPANIETIDSSEISETITGEHKQLESTSTDISTEQKQIEVLSPLITSNIDVLKPIADEENEKTGTGLMQSSSIPFTTFPEELDVGSQSIEQQSMDAESIQQCLRISPDIEVVSQPVVGQEKQADSEEFQDAHHCKHATSPPRSRTPPQSSSFTNSIDGQNISPDIDRKPVVIHGPHDSASRSIPRTTVAAETASTSTDQSTEPGDKVVTSKVADSAVVISTRSDAIVTEVEAAHQEQSSFTGLPAIMQDVLSPVIEVKTAPSCNLLDNATSFETNDTPTLTSTLFTSEPSEKDISLVNTHSLNVQIIPSELNTPVKDVTTTVQGVVETTHKNILPTQDEITSIPEHSLISTYASDSPSFQITDTEHTRLSSTLQTSVEDRKQQDELMNKPSCEKVEVFYDDYPWYLSYYTIADAETKLGTLYRRSYSFNEQNYLLTRVDVHEKLSSHDNEIQNEKDIDDHDDEFHVVHRRKRIPSSTTHTKILPSTAITTKTSISSDIDLEPVILHGHPTAPTITNPIVSETTNIPSKTKHKKKKKDKTEMIFFDAPELISSHAKKEKIHDTQSALVEQEHPSNIETMDSSQLHQTIASAYETLHSTSTEISNEQKQPEVLSALSTSNIDELKPVADNKNELISNDVSVLPSALVTIPSDEITGNTEQNRSPATADFHETPSTDDRELENVKNEDDEGFHIVHRRKRIPSSTTHAKTLPSTTISTESTLSSDIDLEPVIIHGHPTAPTITSPIVSETT